MLAESDDIFSHIYILFADILFSFVVTDNWLKMPALDEIGFNSRLLAGLPLYVCYLVKIQLSLN